jgi:GNAT superfamily N-acetyltransferase
VELIRRARLPGEARAIAAIDTSFTTSRIFTVEPSTDGFRLKAVNLEAPLTKRFALDDLDSPDRPYSEAWVAMEGDVCIGFAAASFHRWNRRLTLWHLYVDGPSRGAGVARRFLRVVEAWGGEQGARHLWLETSSLNAPGIAAYLALGFALTGLDLTLYDATAAEGETAIFLSRPIGARDLGR